MRFRSLRRPPDRWNPRRPHRVKPILIATRQSPLALVQARLVAARLLAVLRRPCELRPMVSTGDRQVDWSLEQRGGKGLFTAELEDSLRLGQADIAVHSAKDLPGEMPPGLAIAGYLPRADPRDVLICVAGRERPAQIATGSPRRRAQLRTAFPGAGFIEIRGNVDTRLKKIAAGQADATVLAAAGMERLGIAAWAGLEFRPFAFDQVVPAVAQGAIAVQCRLGDEAGYPGVFDAATGKAVGVERALQAALGAGCHTATGAHVSGDRLYFFHENTGVHVEGLQDEDFLHPAAFATRFLRARGLA